MKSDLHKILDKIENEQLLRTIYDFLKQSENVEEGLIWKTLTEEQKREIYLSYEESHVDKKSYWLGRCKEKILMQVFVTPRAEQNFDSIVDDINNKWGERPARQFIKKADEIFKLL